MIETKRSVQFPGGLWEESTITLEYDHEMSFGDTVSWFKRQPKPDVTDPPMVPPCPHAHSTRIEVYESDDRMIWRRYWTIPRVAILFNEGGYNTTGMCVDCFLAGLP